MNFNGEALINLRLRELLDITVLSDMSGIPVRTLIRLEAGKEEPTYSQLGILCSLFNVNATYFYN